MNRLFTLFLGLSLVAFSSLRAETPDTTDDAKDKMVCKRMKVTGSRLVKKECHTRGEWEEMAKTASTMGTVPVVQDTTLTPPALSTPMSPPRY